MSSNLAMSVLDAAEFVLVAAVAFLFWRRKQYRRFPATGSYLALRVVSTPLLASVLWQYQRVHAPAWGAAYFIGFWAVYIASTAMLFFICIEIFRSALSAFPGLMKFGIIIFRWAILVSVVVTLSTIPILHRGLGFIPDIANAMMRSVSVLELCLLAFLCLCMNALKLSVRDMAFGMAMGFGTMAANDFVTTLLMTRSTALTAPAQFLYESIILVSLGILVAYCALPEPVRKPLVMPVSSTIYRWNEIASALGHTGTQVAVQQPATSFFLSDVEKVVDKVINRNLKNRESES